MSRMKFNFVRLAVLAVFVAVPIAKIHAQDQIPATDDWNFRVGIPFWAGGTHGTIGAHDREVHINQSFKDTLEALDFAAALNVEVRKDRWLFFSDGEYLKISQTGEPRGRFQGAPAKVELGQKVMFNDLSLGYTVFKNEAVALDLFAGAQLSYSAIDLSLELPRADRTASTSRFWADPIIGVYLNYKFSEIAGFYTKADVGGFHVSYRLTWQVEGGFEFPIAKHFYARAAYRCMSMDFDRRALTIDAIIRGPQLELGVRF